MASIWLTLTENNLHEGGRPRSNLEVYFNLNKDQAAFFGTEPVCVKTDTRRWLVALASGHGGVAVSSHHAKNLRSRPTPAFGQWLIVEKGAKVGDRVQFTDMGDGSFYAVHRPTGETT